MNKITIIRNLKYWIRRLIFDLILRRYAAIDLNLSDKDFEFLCKEAIKNDMSLSQQVEDILRKHAHIS